MHAFLRDVRFGLRMLAKRPLFTGITVFTLALGIGADTALFTVVNALLFKPLPYPDESRLVVIRETKLGESSSVLDGNGASHPNFADWRAQGKSFEHMALVRGTTATLTGAGDPTVVQAAVVSADIFKVLKVAPLLGRDFSPADERPGGGDGYDSVMLSHDFWRSRFEADRKIIGRTVTLDDQPFRVVGVMPEGMFPLRREPVDFWMTTARGGDPGKAGTMNASRGYRAYWGVLARLKPDATVASARSELEAVALGLRERHPEANAKYGVQVAQLRESLIGEARALLLLLFGIVAAVLLIACANVAGMLLSVAVERRREVAVRLALGAGRGRLAAQLLTESLLLTASGGLTGLVFSVWCVEGLSRLVPEDVPRISGLSPDWRVLLFTFVVSAATGLICGLVTVMTVSRTDLTEALKDGSRGAPGGASRGLFRNVLVTGQIAVTLTLLMGAGLMLKSLVNLLRVDPGFEFRNVLTMRLVLPAERYRKPENVLNFYGSLTERIGALPGVDGVSIAQSVPLTPIDNGTNVEIVGRPFPPGQQPEARLRFVGLRYFQTVGIPKVAGRDFTADDDGRAARVVIVNEAFARRFFDGENPIGKKLLLGWGGDEPKEIVGVFGNVRHRGPSDSARPEMYVPFAQFPSPDMALLVRSRVEPESLISAVRLGIRELEPEAPVTDVRTLDQYRRDTVALPRFNAFLLSGFAGLALVLSMAGLYGMMAYSVARRTGEFGIRMALGAQKRDVLALVLKQGLQVVVMAVMFGFAGNFILARLLNGLLFEVGPGDPTTFVAVSGVLILTALAACLIPARRAAETDPLTALGCD